MRVTETEIRMSETGKPSAELQQLVADADTGGRAASGASGAIITAVALAWSAFQLWYPSPPPKWMRHWLCTRASMLVRQQAHW